MEQKSKAAEGKEEVMQLFLDCDGVLADFDSYAEKIFGLPPRKAEALHGAKRFWADLQSHEGFYRNLPLMPDAKELFDAVAHMKPIILTGLPRGDWAEPQKREWGAKHFPHTTMICCMSADKRNHMKPGDILVDDFLKYKNLWEEAGGIFVHHTSAANSIEKLKQLGVLPTNPTGVETEMEMNYVHNEGCPCLAFCVAPHERVSDPCNRACLQCTCKPAAEPAQGETKYKARDWNQPHLQALNYLNNCELDGAEPVSLGKLREILDVPDRPSQPSLAEGGLPPLTKPIHNSRFWDEGIEWALAEERAARLEREAQLAAELQTSQGLREQLAGAWANRDHFCHYLNEIARLFWGDNKQCYAPDAVLRKVESELSSHRGSLEAVTRQRIDPEILAAVSEFLTAYREVVISGDDLNAAGVFAGVKRILDAKGNTTVTLPTIE